MKRAIDSNVLIYNGMHSKVIALDKLNLAIKIFPVRLEYNAMKEYELLQLLNQSKIKCVPKIYGIVKAENAIILVKEYIQGEYFSDFIEKRGVIEVANMFKKLLECLHKIDKIGVTIKELSTPRKNIIVKNGEPFIIDLERWVQEAKKTNVTQFIGFLYKAMLRNDEIGSKIRKIINEENLLAAAKEYKTRIRIDRIIKSIFKV